MEKKEAKRKNNELGFEITFRDQTIEQLQIDKQELQIEKQELQIEK